MCHISLHNPPMRSKTLFKIIACTLLYIICGSTVYAQQQTYILRSFDYSTSEVWLSKSRSWRKLTLSDSRNLVLNPSDSIRIKDGRVSIIIKDNTKRTFFFWSVKEDKVATARKGTWSVKDIVNGKEVAFTYSPTGDANKSIDNHEVSLKILSMTGEARDVFQVGEQVYAEIINRTNRPIYYSIWWKDENGISNLLNDDNSWCAFARSFSAVPGTPVRIGEPSGQVDVYLFYSKKDFATPVILQSGLTISGFEDKFNKERSCIIKHITVK